MGGSSGTCLTTCAKTWAYRTVAGRASYKESLFQSTLVRASTSAAACVRSPWPAHRVSSSGRGVPLPPCR